MSQRRQAKNIFCIIPAYNESGNIVRVTSLVKPHVRGVVVIDDGSADGTGALAKNAGAVVLRHLTNRGQGAALETGNRYALGRGADIIVHFDADGQFSADEIGALVAPIARGEYDAVFGSRFLGRESNMPWAKKRIIFPLARLVNRMFFGINLSDPQSGFRALSRKAAEIIRIENDGSAHCSEIMHKAFKHNLKITEVPVTVKYSEFGQGIFGGGRGRKMGGVRILIDLILKKILS